MSSQRQGMPSDAFRVSRDVREALPMPNRIMAPVRWYGGKGQIARRIVPLIPKGKVYVEPYCGAASVFWHIKPFPVEVLNDLDERTIGLFRVLQDPEKFELLAHKLTWTMYSRAEFRKALEIMGDESADDVDRAWAMFVGQNQGFGGKCNAECDWGRVFTSTRGMAQVVNSWRGRLRLLDSWHERLSRVQIDCRDAIEVIRYWDSKETVFYVDPPYVSDTRASGSRNVYEHEMSDDAHAELVEVLLNLEGKAVVSGYNHPIYAQLDDAGWQRRDIETACHAAGRVRGTKLQGSGSITDHAPRTESVWISPSASKPMLF